MAGGNIGGMGKKFWSSFSKKKLFSISQKPCYLWYADPTSGITFVVYCSKKRSSENNMGGRHAIDIVYGGDGDPIIKRIW